MRVHTVTSSPRSRYTISQTHREFCCNSSDLGEAAIPRRWSGAINRTGYWSPTCDDKKRAVARDVGGRRRERRKEVALGRLITVSLILILGAWGGAVNGAFPDDAAAAPSSATRQQPPAPPIKYLEAGARLFNSAADGAQLDLASKYLQAAETYRDQLQTDEQATLDAYLKELAKAKAAIAGGAPAPSATPAPAVRRRAAGVPSGCGRRAQPPPARLPPTRSSQVPIRGSAADGCFTKRGSKFIWATTTGPSKRSTRPRRWTLSGGSSTTRPPR